MTGQAGTSVLQRAKLWLLGGVLGTAGVVAIIIAGERGDTISDTNQLNVLRDGSVVPRTTLMPKTALAFSVGEGRLVLGSETYPKANIVLVLMPSGTLMCTYDHLTCLEFDYSPHSTPGNLYWEQPRDQVPIEHLVRIATAGSADFANPGVLLLGNHSKGYVDWKQFKLTYMPAAEFNRIGFRTPAAATLAINSEGRLMIGGAKGPVSSGGMEVRTTEASCQAKLDGGDFGTPPGSLYLFQDCIQERAIASIGTSNQSKHTEQDKPKGLVKPAPAVPAIIDGSTSGLSSNSPTIPPQVSERPQPDLPRSERYPEPEQPAAPQPALDQAAAAVPVPRSLQRGSNAEFPVDEVRQPSSPFICMTPPDQLPPQIKEACRGGLSTAEQKLRLLIPNEVTQSQLIAWLRERNDRCGSDASCFADMTDQYFQEHVRSK